ALEAETAFPALGRLERRHGSLLRGALAARRRTGTRPSLHVVEGGIARLAEAIAADLGGAWRPSWPVERLERAGEAWRITGPDVLEADRVVAAVPPEELARIHPSLAPAVDAADWAPVAVVWLGLDGDLPPGFGTLVGPDEGFATLGFLYESSYAPHRAPPGRGLVKAIVGGATAPGVVDADDAALVERVTLELGRVLGSDPVPEFSHVVRHRPGIPQYTPARSRMVELLRRSLPGGLEVAGWAYDGVGVARLAARAAQL
ncbi:MAG: protoporphyrinogen/coproporphyrinogen oxidase, partial [Actinomycetota bacterium]